MNRVGVAAAAPAAIRAARASDLPGLLELLSTATLPGEGVAQWLARFVVAEHAGTLVGAAGVEWYAEGSLLRSVVVAPEWRGRGLGRALVDAVLSSGGSGARDVYLLTTTAEHWFPRLGFVGVARDEVPASVRESVEFREACPASAIVMVRRAPSGGPAAGAAAEGRAP